MQYLQNQIGWFVILVGALCLSGCLTPEERLQVYGVKAQTENTTEVRSNNADISKSVDSSKIIYQSPKAAPTTRVTTNEIQPLRGLRGVDEGLDVANTIPPASDCGATEHAYLTGQSMASMGSLRFKQQIRVIMPGQMITQDYSAQRLNFDITVQGNIGRIWCG